MCSVNQIDDFKGESVLLIALPGHEMKQLLRAFAVESKAELVGDYFFTTSVRPGPSIFRVVGKSVEVTLDAAKSSEIMSKAQALDRHAGPGHQYVDIDGPVGTLVIAKDEYLT